MALGYVRIVHSFPAAGLEKDNHKDNTAAAAVHYITRKAKAWAEPRGSLIAVRPA